MTYDEAIDDPATIEALLNYGLFKYFRVPRMKSYIRLLEYIINMWDPNEEHFVVRTHALTIDIKDIYFSVGLSWRGRPVVLSSARGGEASFDDLIDKYYSLGTQPQSRKLRIQQIVNLPLRKIVYTIGKVVETRSSRLTMMPHMLYSIECMAPTVFNWSKGMLSSLKEQLNKCKWGTLK